MPGLLCCTPYPHRHFLNAGKRLLGLSYQSIKGGLIGVEYDRRTVSCPMRFLILMLLVFCMLQGDSGCFGLILYPLDTVRTRLQATAGAKLSSKTFEGLLQRGRPRHRRQRPVRGCLVRRVRHPQAACSRTSSPTTTPRWRT